MDFFFSHSSAVPEPCIAFYGGEPLLNFDLIRKCVEHAKRTKHRQCSRFSITTNAQLITDDIAKFFVDEGFFVVISLDGPEFIHDRCRRTIEGQRTYGEVITALERLHSCNEEYFRRNVSINAVLAPPFRFTDRRAFFDEHKILSKVALRLSEVAPGIKSESKETPVPEAEELSYEAMRQSYISQTVSGGPRSRFLCSLFEPGIVRIHKRTIHGGLGRLHFPNGICLPGVRKLFVDTSGNLMPCEKVPHSLQIGDIFAGYDFKAIKKLIKDYCQLCAEECVRCWAIRLCGQCFATSWSKHLDRHLRKKECDKVRSGLHESLRTYCEIREKNVNALNFMRHISIS
jgi:uncharacterized protein